MYHEITTKEKARKRRNHVIAAILACALVGMLVVALHFAHIGAREQGAVAMRKSILDAALRCCAIEGSYPLSLSHLEESYGLRINHNDYIITYEAYATNMVPSVVVIPR